MKIAIVNDLPIAVEALRRALALAPEHEVVWVAYTGLEAVELCVRQLPDLVLGADDLCAPGAPLLAKIATIGRLLGGKDLPNGKVPRVAAGCSVRCGLVAIGASAGGPAALATVLRALPRNFPAAIVIVQHVGEQFVAGMAEWLGRDCALPVAVAREGDPPRPGAVLL
jgi:two-component system, chemotaxis family, response regulator WspF